MNPGTHHPGAIDFETPATHPDARILCIDDMPANLLLLRKLLAKAGYNDVVTTSDPREADWLVREVQPDLMILDLHMPEISGYDLLSLFRERGETFPILVFTADVTGETRREALQRGANDFLTKPGDPIEVMLRVRNTLETRFLYKEVRKQNEGLAEMVRERTQKLEDAQLEIVHRLALAGEFRDDDTGDHCRRVGDLSADIAREYGLASETIELIRIAAPLHDIGKVGISDGILRKPARLTPEEFDEVKKHVQVGANILADSASEILRMAYEIARSHHERWDGTGYCDGLAGEAIPISGRIVAVADVFDALTNHRPYKRVWPVEDAIAEISRSSGSHFDPDVVAAFLRVMAAGELRAA